MDACLDSLGPKSRSMEKLEMIAEAKAEHEIANDSSRSVERDIIEGASDASNTTDRMEDCFRMTPFDGRSASKSHT